MVSIVKRNKKEGKEVYGVRLREKNVQIYRTFKNEEDANLYAFYKERLLNNMKQFNIPIEERFTINQMFELKLEKIPNNDVKSRSDMLISLSRLQNIFGENRFYSDISLEEWMDATKKLMTLKVFRGAKNKKGERTISVKSVKKILAHASSCISSLIAEGLKLENNPLKVIQSTLNFVEKEPSS